jgi:hypothetical protein
MSGIASACLSCLSTVDRWCHITACLGPIGGRSRDGIYETTLADNEREAVSDLLGYLENVCINAVVAVSLIPVSTSWHRSNTNSAVLIESRD